MSAEIQFTKPQVLSEALELLRQPGGRAVPMAGGTWLVPRLQRGVPGSLAGTVDTVVDLSALGLNTVQLDQEEGLELGATATLAAVATHDGCRRLAGGILAEAARRAAPANIRNAATVGGTIVCAEPESELLLALLALAAQAVIDDGQPRPLPLSDLLPDPHATIGRGLIVKVHVPPLDPSVSGSLARVARTPADYPIVAAAAVTDGTTARIALGGVAPSPLLLRLGSPAELDAALATVLADVDIPADFRGSADYRRAMAPILAHRALAQATP
jgi:carbon-monoxide dehydrogenase medium subunit